MKGAPAPPNTPLPIVVSQAAPSSNGNGVCQLASQTPASWYTRATTDGSHYSWATLASLGIGQGMPTPAPITGNFTISWQAPTKNVDGTSPVTPLSGYGIWQGASATTLAQVATVAATLLTWTSPQLSAGVYYFGIEAIAADGSDSVMSNVVTGTIVPPEVPGAPTSVLITASV